MRNKYTFYNSGGQIEVIHFKEFIYRIRCVSSEQNDLLIHQPPPFSQAALINMDTPELATAMQMTTIHTTLRPNNYLNDWVDITQFANPVIKCKGTLSNLEETLYKAYTELRQEMISPDVLVRINPRLWLLTETGKWTKYVKHQPSDYRRIINTRPKSSVFIYIARSEEKRLPITRQMRYMQYVEQK